MFGGSARGNRPRTGRGSRVMAREGGNSSDEAILLPRPNRDELIEIRRGKYSLTEIQELGIQLESEALAAQATSPLPEEVDRDAISRLLADAHLRFWSAS